MNVLRLACKGRHDTIKVLTFSRSAAEILWEASMATLYEIGIPYRGHQRDLRIDIGMTAVIFTGTPHPDKNAVFFVDESQYILEEMLKGKVIGMTVNSTGELKP